MLADVLRTEFGGATSVADLYQAVRTSVDGKIPSGLFGTHRRVAATIRADKRINGDDSVLVLAGGQVKLRSKRVVKAHQSAHKTFLAEKRKNGGTGAKTASTKAERREKKSGAKRVSKSRKS